MRPYRQLIVALALLAGLVSAPGADALGTICIDLQQQPCVIRAGNDENACPDDTPGLGAHIGAHDVCLIPYN